MSPKALKAYEKEKKYPILFDEGLYALAKKVITSKLFSGNNFVRHHPDFLANIIVDL